MRTKEIFISNSKDKDALTKILDGLKLAKSQGFKIGINSVIHKENFNEIEELLQFSRKQVLFEIIGFGLVS